ncbi:hypothetical protein CR513_14817, partial [Mucuna pruriens]
MAKFSAAKIEHEINEVLFQSVTESLEEKGKSEHHREKEAEPSSPWPRELSRPKPTQSRPGQASQPNSPLRCSPIRSGPIVQSTAAIQLKGHLSSSLAATLGTKKPKVTRGDQLNYQRTLVGLILSVLASGGEPSLSTMAIIVEDGVIESRPCSEIESVRLCCVCPHLAETSRISLYQDHIRPVPAESERDEVGLDSVSDSGKTVGIQRSLESLPSTTIANGRTIMVHQEKRHEEEPWRRYEEEPWRRYEEEPHKERREKRYEEPYPERRRYFKSSHRDEREVPKKAPMDTLKCHTPPFARDGDDIVELYDYATMDNLRQLTSRKSYPSGPSNLRDKEKEKERPRKGKSSKKGSSIP